MDAQAKPGYIELIGYPQPSDAERADVHYKPKLTINKTALKIICERFQSPISVLVFTGDMGAGKSKLASLTAATLSRQQCTTMLLPFPSRVNLANVTRGIWMWRRPLKHLNVNKKGSILLLDCEGVNSYNQNISADLYLFCMIISTVFGVILRNGRVDQLLGDRLHSVLTCFEEMRTPYILPNLWLVPLELPRLKHDDKIISEYEWVEKAFSSELAGGTLSKKESDFLQERFDYIRKKLQKIGVANIDYLPNVFKNNDLTMNAMLTLLREESNKYYYHSLYAAIDRFTQSACKRLPGSSSPTLLVRPCELAELMEDLINVINKDRRPNADELLGKYLWKRFDDEIIGQKTAEFEHELLLYAVDYAKNNLKQKATDEKKQTTTDDEKQKTMDKKKEEALNALREKRQVLINKYSEQMKKLAESKIYGPGSALLTSNLYTNNLAQVEIRMNQYTDPEILINQVLEIQGKPIKIVTKMTHLPETSNF